MLRSAILSMLVAAQPLPAARPIMPAMLRPIIATLASDAYGGRAPDTPGGARTEVYLIAAFRAAGLVAAAPGGGWRQRVTIPAAGQVNAVLGAIGIGGGAADTIIGRLPGRTPEAGAVLVTAHWDHLGICRPPGTVDRICNGAIDNASGVAALIAIARLLARGPRTPRDVIFAATTGEEEGELGAKALAADPPVPIGRIVAAFNLDTVAIAPAGSPIAIVGATPALVPLIRAVAATERRVIDETGYADRYANRQDGYALARAGIPAAMVESALADRVDLEAYLATRYHSPADDSAHPIDLGGAADDANLHLALIRAFADPARYRPPR